MRIPLPELQEGKEKDACVLRICPGYKVNEGPGISGVDKQHTMPKDKVDEGNSGVVHSKQRKGEANSVTVRPGCNTGSRAAAV